MPPDPALVEDTRAWLQRAANDLRAADLDLVIQPPLLADAAFHAQQAVEKHLKAFLTWHDLPFRRTHDLAELGRQCVSVDASIESVCRNAEPLTPYAWVFRYPNEGEDPLREEVEQALSLAREVEWAVLARLPDDVNV